MPITIEISQFIDEKLGELLVSKYLLPLKQKNSFTVSGSNITTYTETTQSVVTFPNAVTSSLPVDFSVSDFDNYKFFVNGQLIEYTAIDELKQSGSNFVLTVNYDRLNFPLYHTDQVTVWGSFV